jgi:hypothetical protein
MRRAALIGAGVWVAPVVSSVRLPAAAQVGSPAPEPTQTETVTPSPTTTPPPSPGLSPSPTPPTEVGGVEIVNPGHGGAGLAETGQNVIPQAAAGIGLAALGSALRKIGDRASGQTTEGSNAREDT